MSNPLEILSTYTFGTPDFGHSDIWHFNFALKFILSNALKIDSFPFWSKDIGTGYPLLGEGQIGMFNLYNLVAFRFLNPILAFNLGFALIFLTSAFGTYLFCRTIKLSKLSSFFAALIFSLSGYFATQAVHFNLIQAASFLPWLFFLAEKLFQKGQIRWGVLFAFVLSQQIYAGFLQIVMISLIGVFLYSLLKKNPKFILILGLSTFGGAILALPQLYASWQLSQFSFRSGGLSVNTLADFPFSLKNFLSFILPYFFGDPRNGTYPPYSPNWGIFWESTPYLGIIPLILAILGWFNKRFQKINKTLVIILFASAILLLGKSTPLFFIFQIPPLSFFRVPARFLWIFIWSLILLAAIGFEKLSSRFKLVVLIISLADLAIFSFQYNSVINTKSWLEAPESVKIITKDKSWFRVYANNPYNEWNAIKGWGNMESFYPFRNSLDPNQNIYWHIPSADFYAGLAPKRLELFKSLIDQSPASQSAKLLSLAGVKYYLTTSAKNDLNFTFLASTPRTPSFLIYQNPAAKSHAYLTTNFETVATLEELKEKITDTNNDKTLLEEEVAIKQNPNPAGEAIVTLNSDNEVEILSLASRKSLLVLSDSYYPGWKAVIDNLPAKIHPANLNQRAVIVPAGKHFIKFQFSPLQIF